MLWVGNSFFYRNNSMHTYVRDLLKSVGKTGSQGCRGTSATISGSGLNWHDIEAYLKPGGVGSYSFVAGNEVRFNTFDKPFDAVMMMDCSQCPIHPKLQPLFFEYARKDSEIARRHGAEPVFFMSWAYADKPRMTGQLAACTVLASVYNQSPVGNKYTAGLPRDVAAHLQNVAWDTVQAFQAKEGRGSLE